MQKDILICIFLHTAAYYSVYGIEIRQLQDGAYSLGQNLGSITEDSSGRDRARELYEQQSGNMRFAAINGSQIVLEMAQTIGNILDKKMRSLKASVEYAEQLAAVYKWNPDLKKEEVSETYVHAKRLNDSGPGYEYSDQFKASVDVNTSSVHIPVEIFEGSASILNALTWTSGLDEIWRRNKEEDPDLLWQYFGSQTGLMRIYPASRWRGHGSVDLFDVRRRPWYTQGASSPKNMLILMDTSGSTFGQTLALMKQAARSLLDTLNENDYVNIAHFSSNASMIGCFDEFVQANFWNKKKLKEDIDNLEAKGMAYYDAGFKFGFQQFAAFHQTQEESDKNVGAACNDVIMFLTDGGSDTADKIFKEYNWPEKKVRVFSYAVGPTANPISGPEWIACANRGRFYRIQAMGAIRSTVQKYFQLLSDGLVGFDAHDIRWSRSYLDQGGLGMMTTVTLPVFNTSAASTNQTILGVMGSDVTVTELEKVIPTEKLTANGYAFAINANGFVVFHPNFQAVKGYLTNPPNVDFLDVEAPSEEKELLRQRMIDHDTGSMTIDTYNMLPDFLHMDEVSRTYHFTRIPNSQFSLAVVLPTYAQKYYTVSGYFDPDDALEALTEDVSAILAAPWKICANISRPDNETSHFDILVDTISNSPEACEDEELQRLLLDTIATQGMNGYWPSHVTDGVDAMFVATEGRLTRIFPPSAAEYLKGHADTVSQVYYRRALDNPDLWVYSSRDDWEPTSFNDTPPVVMAVRAVTMNQENYIPAVIGVMLSPESLRAQLLSAVPQCTPEVQCYLLDDAGFIMATSDPDLDVYIGEALESVDSPVMHALWQQEVFAQHEDYDYQAACSLRDDSDNAGFRSVLPPAIFEVLSIHWWTAKAWWAYVNFNVMSWISDLWSPSQMQVMAEDFDEPMENKSCISHQAQYGFSNSGSRQLDTTVACNNCTRRVLSSGVEGTNLLLVVVLGDCSEEYCIHPSVLRYPERDVPDPVFYDSDGLPRPTCNVTARYRRRPQGCYDYNPEEDFSDCNKAPSVALSLYLVVASIIATLLT